MLIVKTICPGFGGPNEEPLVCRLLGTSASCMGRRQTAFGQVNVLAAMTVKFFREISTMDIHELLLYRAAVICDNQHVAVVAKKK